MSPSGQQPVQTEAGFGLLDALVGLTLLAVALLMSLSLLWRLPATLQRLEAQREVTRTTEAVLEGIRSGLVPLVPGEVKWEVVMPERVSSKPSSFDTLLMWMEVKPGRPHGLFTVTLKTRHTVREQVFERTLETMAWRP